MSTFDFTTSTLTFEAIQDWTVETVEAFLKFKQKDFSLNDAEIQKFVDCSINGPALLNVNFDDLISLVGLKVGPALNISVFVKNLNNQNNTPTYCRQIATPFESLPNISELNSALLQSFNLKIPLSPILYNKCKVFCNGFPIFEYFVECPWEIRLDEEDACYPEEFSNYCNAALQGAEVGSSEFSRTTLSNYRNTKDSSITLAGLRPDYWECFNGVLVFKGEEKPTENDLIDAKRLLISKMGAWNRCLYGDLKYILAYAVGGAYLQFYAIDPSFNLHLISDTLNLDHLKDRVKALICIFNIHRIIRSMESLLPETVVPVFKLFKRTYGDIFITDTEIEKRITSFKTYPFSNITVLSYIYRNTKNNRNIIHAVRGPQIVNNTYKVNLAPVGVRRIPSTEQEVKAAIRCVLNALVDLHELGYVHRDVQWSNILQLADSSWMLIDLECAGMDDQFVNFGPLKNWAPEVIKTKIYTKKADVYMVGRLLSDVFISLSEKAYKFASAITAELEFRLTAQEARQHPWLSNI
ncbi:31956_t:CDS:2 [Gigaspora margarita]|uniref:31956_t:CDS:1 n=1 Tax=Gigaspora margarita TaxID=4874 RepID=A0ABN7UXG8_GIGMA|nr:31956_t:CDS:2 [Gigaspora margarita]